MSKFVTVPCSFIVAASLAMCLADAPSFVVRTLAELGVFLSACVVAGYALAWACEGEAHG